MAHFLVVEDTPTPEMLQLTLVIGDATAETIRLVAAVLEVLRGMPASETEQRKRPRRIDWEAALRATGYPSGRDRFYEKVGELSDDLFPDWTPDELACHPHEAQQFCDAVRRVVGPVPGPPRHESIDEPPSARQGPDGIARAAVVVAGMKPLAGGYGRYRRPDRPLHAGLADQGHRLRVVEVHDSLRQAQRPQVRPVRPAKPGAMRSR